MTELYHIEGETGNLFRDLPTGERITTTLGVLTLGEAVGFSADRVLLGDGTLGKYVPNWRNMQIIHVTEGQTYFFEEGNPETFNDPRYVDGQPIVLYTKDVAIPSGDIIPLAETIASVRPVGTIIYVDPSKRHDRRFVKVVPDYDSVTGQVLNAPTGMLPATWEELVQNAIAGHLAKHAKQQVLSLFHSPANVAGHVFYNFYEVVDYIASLIVDIVKYGLLTAIMERLNR